MVHYRSCAFSVRSGEFKCDIVIGKIAIDRKWSFSCEDKEGLGVVWVILEVERECDLYVLEIRRCRKKLSVVSPVRDSYTNTTEGYASVPIT